ncbi:hypothetical protein U9M73_13190 [Paenibacillus phoenicis]|uniref:Uncharacterized protein n=1 Tax=Paenibacillus phoenicis TaxID=554117 RepID=A0ABU5PM17_9BACL|nr:hypothetical protein [Paenibacillus phoenicis]MEA3570940.1 hypothetical protein [Paenibacillus phoenicis]
MKKFEAIEVYKQKSAEIGQRRSELQARLRAAQEGVQSLKAAYAEAVRKSVVEGADNATEIEEIDKKIEQAERTLRRVDAEVNAGLAVSVGVGGKDEIAAAWNTDYYPNVVMRQTLEPALERLNAAACAYADEFERVLSIIDEVDAIYYDAKTTLGHGYEYKLRNLKNELRHVSNPLTKAALTPDDLSQLASGIRPAKLPKTGTRGEK